MVIAITIISTDRIRNREKMMKKATDKDPIAVYNNNRPVVILIINSVFLLMPTEQKRKKNVQFLTFSPEKGYLHSVTA